MERIWWESRKRMEIQKNCLEEEKDLKWPKAKLKKSNILFEAVNGN